MITHRILKTSEECLATFTLLQQLDPELSAEKFRESIEARNDGGPFFAGTFMDSRLVGAAVFYQMVSISGQKILWIFDMVTDAAIRGQGIGSGLLAFIEEHAKAIGCEHVRVHSLLWRKDAHRFYTAKNKFEEWAVIFAKCVEENRK